jgi:hypothetical protein
VVGLKQSFNSLEAKIDRLLAMPQLYQQHVVPAVQSQMPQFVSAAAPMHSPYSPVFGMAQQPTLESMASFQQHAVCGMLEMQPGSPSHSPSLLSPASSPSSPGRFPFQCPICSHPQYTPKSHCGHIRKLLDGTGYCRFRNDVHFHGAVLQHFGNVAKFVSWYTPQMRSSVGKDFSDADIQDYQQLQVNLRTVAACGTSSSPM